MDHKERLYKALKTKLEADVNEALLTLDLCFNKPVAIGEHTSEHFVNEASKALDKLTEARDKIDVLNTYLEGDIGGKKLLND